MIFYIFFCMHGRLSPSIVYAYAAWAGQGGLAASQVITAETRGGHLKLSSDANDARLLATGCTSENVIHHFRMEK